MKISCWFTHPKEIQDVGDLFFFSRTEDLAETMVLGMMAQ